MFSEYETKIIERLKEKLPEVHVAPLRDIEAVPSMRQLAPALWVIYDGYSVGEVNGVPGTIQQVRMEWFVVVATKNATSRGGVVEARDEASDLCARVLNALLGFHLGAGRYLRLSDAPGPEYSGGYCHVPLAFFNTATFKGQT